MKRRVPGSACFANEQCLDGSECLNGYCKCGNGTKLLSRLMKFLNINFIGNLMKTIDMIDLGIFYRYNLAKNF